MAGQKDYEVTKVFVEMLKTIKKQETSLPLTGLGRLSTSNGGVSEKLANPVASTGLTASK